MSVIETLAAVLCFWFYVLMHWIQGDVHGILSWHSWHQTCKNRRPYNLYCVGADVKPCSINGSRLNNSGISCGQTSVVVSGKGVVLQWECFICHTDDDCLCRQQWTELCCVLCCRVPCTLCLYSCWQRMTQCWGLLVLPKAGAINSKTLAINSTSLGFTQSPNSYNCYTNCFVFSTTVAAQRMQLTVVHLVIWK